MISKGAVVITAALIFMGDIAAFLFLLVIGDINPLDLLI